MAILKTLSINGKSYYVSPDDYTITTEGEPSKIVQSSNGYILDIGYVRQGFTARLLIADSSDVIELQSLALSAIQNNSPITIIDNVYPSTKTWIGFFKLPIVTMGSMTTPNLYSNAGSLIVNPVTINFYNKALEMM